MLAKITNSPTQAAFLLSESSKSADLLDMNSEVCNQPSVQIHIKLLTLYIPTQVKINRLPGVLSICRKDQLAKKHAVFQDRFGSEEFHFVPETFSIPSEREKGPERMVRTQIPDIPNMREIGGLKQKNLWIVKPCIRSGGDGIHLIDNIFDIPTVDEKLEDVVETGGS